MIPHELLDGNARIGSNAHTSESIIFINNISRLINTHMINMLAIRFNVIDKIGNIRQHKYLTNKEKKRNTRCMHGQFCPNP